MPAFDAVFAAASIQIMKTPPQAPRANAVCERIVGTLRREPFDRILIVNQAQLRRMLDGYLIHYHGHRPHRSGRRTTVYRSHRPLRDRSDAPKSSAGW